MKYVLFEKWLLTGLICFFASVISAAPIAPQKYLFTIGAKQVEFVDDTSFEKPFKKEDGPEWVKNLTVPEAKEIMASKCFSLIAQVFCHWKKLDSQYVRLPFAGWDYQTRVAFLQWIKDFAEHDKMVNWSRLKCFVIEDTKTTFKADNSDKYDIYDIKLFDCEPDLLVHYFFGGEDEAKILSATFKIAFMQGQKELALGILNKLSDEQREIFFEKMKVYQFGKTLKSEYGKQYPSNERVESMDIGKDEQPIENKQIEEKPQIEPQQSSLYPNLNNQDQIEKKAPGDENQEIELKKNHPDLEVEKKAEQPKKYTYIVGDKKLAVDDLEQSQEETKKFVDSLSKEELYTLLRALEKQWDYEGLFWLGYVNRYDFSGRFKSYAKEDRRDFYNVLVKYKKYPYNEIRAAVIKSYKQYYQYYDIYLLAADPDFVYYSLDASTLFETFIHAFNGSYMKQKVAKELINSLDHDHFFKLWDEWIHARTFEGTFCDATGYNLLNQLISSRQSEQDRYRCVRDMINSIVTKPKSEKFEVFAKDFIQKLTPEQFGEFYADTTDEKLLPQIRKYATLGQLFYENGPYGVFARYGKKVLPTLHSFCDHAAFAIPAYLTTHVSFDKNGSPLAGKYVTAVLGAIAGIFCYGRIIGLTDEHAFDSSFGVKTFGVACFAGLGHTTFNCWRERRAVNAKNSAANSNVPTRWQKLVY